jgi:hypothetical protein
MRIAYRSDNVEKVFYIRVGLIREYTFELRNKLQDCAVGIQEESLLLG